MPEKKHGKRYTELAKKIDRAREYQPAEGVKLVKETSQAKFDTTVELHMRMGVDPKHADQMVRGAAVLPHGTGKSVRVIAFAQGEKAREAQAAGADVVGAEDLAKRIEGGWMEFDVAIATPDLMGQVGKLGRVLGPRGLMPNPKSGTVTFDVAKAVRDAKGGRVEFRVDKTAVIHTPSSGKVLLASRRWSRTSPPWSRRSTALGRGREGSVTSERRTQEHARAEREARSRRDT